MTAEPTLTRYRVRYQKQAALRYTGHLDLHRAWERSLRRARLPVAYSQGFHPQARMQQASALPLGFTSRCEVIDLWLVQALPAEQVAEAIRAAVPPGLLVEEVSVVEGKQPALQTLVWAAEYRAELLEELPLAALQQAVDALLKQEALPRQRREKTYDLRPLILELAVRRAEPRPTLWMRLAAREGATGRPEEVLSALGLDPLQARVERERLVWGEEKI